MAQGAIVYREMGNALHDAVRKAGHRIWCENGVWLGDDAASVQAVIDAFDPLTEPRATALVAAQAQFDGRIAAGRIIGTKTYQIDDASRAAMLQTFNSATWPVTWITADNSTISLSQAQFQGGCQNVLAYYNAMRLNFRSLKNAIAAANTLPSLQQVDVTSGWPSNP